MSISVASSIIFSIAVSSAQLVNLAQWMAADFSNQTQAFANPPFVAHIRVCMRPLLFQFLGVLSFYLEQAYDFSLKCVRKLEKLGKMGKLLQQLTLGLILAISLVILGILGDIQPVFATSPPSPLSCRLGVYLLSLQDFNISEKSFSADFWIWINCPTQSPDILQRIDFLNSKEINPSLDSEEQKGEIYWATHKIQGVFQHNWDIRSFPFDRHILTIDLEHGLLDKKQLVYIADNQNSSYQKDIKIDGWNITDFRVTEYTKEYNTTYGDPTLQPGTVSEFSHIQIAITIQRSSLIVFLKLTTAVYTAVGISFAIYLVQEFEARLGALIGALFAIVINQQVVDSTGSIPLS
jgi:hypothetical protein